MSTNKPWYEFDKSRVYRSDERYNTGEGLSVMTQDLEHATALFTHANDFADGRIYAVHVKRLDTGEVLMHSGPSMETATRSMLAAYRRRRAEPREAA